MQHLEIVEKLSLHEQFRLVEIAHETSNSEIREAALAILQEYLNPLVVRAEKMTEADLLRGLEHLIPANT